MNNDKALSSKGQVIVDFIEGVVKGGNPRYIIQFYRTFALAFDSQFPDLSLKEKKELLRAYHEEGLIQLDIIDSIRENTDG